VRARAQGDVSRILLLSGERSQTERGEWYGRSKEKDFQSEAGFAPGAEYEAAFAGAFRMPALS
jgi:hypothetical protein